MRRKPVQNDLAALNAEEDAKMLAENRRLCGEVRRLRRALRKIALGPECLSAYGMEQEARAALAPRRRKS